MEDNHPPRLAAVFLVVAFLGACADIGDLHGDNGGNSVVVAPTDARDDRSVAASYWKTMVDNALLNSNLTVADKRAPAEIIWRASDLPLKGTAAVVPWSQSYWSFASGGVQRRLQTGQSDYSILTKSAVLKLDSSGLSKLSPTEKYDVLMNFLEDDPASSHHFLTTKQMRSYVRAENAKGFALGGFCHAWATLATALKEPKERTIDGLSHLGNVSLRFSSADIAALMSLNVHLNQTWALDHGRYAEVGRRCSANQAPGAGSVKLVNGTDCGSINAGTFHVIVTNQLGRLGLPVIVDTRPDYVVVNEPLFSYVIEESSQVARLSFEGPLAPNTAVAKFYRMKAEYAVSPVDPIVAGGARIKKIRWHAYRVELDASGEVIGGSWARNTESYTRPDFVWTLVPPPASASLPKLGLLTGKSGP
jgi:hypothetical protein